MSVAVLTLAHGRHSHLRAQIAGLARGQRQPHLHVVAAMDDPDIARVTRLAWDSAGSNVTPVVVEVPHDARGLPLATARNLAAETAMRRGATQLVFLDVDCIPGPTTVATYRSWLAGARTRAATSPALCCGDVAYLPPLSPGQVDWAGDNLDLLADAGEHRPDRVRLAPGEQRPEADLNRFWSLSFGLSADDFRRAGGFCDAFVGYGGEDTDFVQKVGSRGGSLTWVGGATAYHQHHASTSPPVQHVEAIVRNAGIFAERWGWWPMEGWLQAFRDRGLAEQDAAGRWRVAA